jgi:hypothetical protein
VPTSAVKPVTSSVDMIGGGGRCPASIVFSSSMPGRVPSVAKIGDGSCQVCVRLRGGAATSPAGWV